MSSPSDSTQRTHSKLDTEKKRIGKRKEKRYKREPKKPIFDPLKPNEVWSADFKGKFLMGNKIYCYPLTVIGSYSRYVLFTAKRCLMSIKRVLRPKL